MSVSVAEISRHKSGQTEQKGKFPGIEYSKIKINPRPWELFRLIYELCNTSKTVSRTFATVYCFPEKPPGVNGEHFSGPKTTLRVVDIQDNVTDKDECAREDLDL